MLSLGSLAYIKSAYILFAVWLIQITVDMRQEANNNKTYMLQKDL